MWPTTVQLCVRQGNRLGMPLKVTEAQCARRQGTTAEKDNLKDMYFRVV